ncbi:hypothetical protein JOF53_006376 [Crossiella equi]|uniref:Peptidase S1 domain-containing protein n=1 Tax=Crossiella equi TaxID=130796 RepID=A0ABS5AMU1_9PSEU|nr:AbfB domain-containing protein [Crossiella equi]MBP2477504.1 hypothetical protein [Crossiella equi]
MARSRFLLSIVAGALATTATITFTPSAGALTNGVPATGNNSPHRQTALINTGERHCSGVLVDPQWLMTAKSCFGQDVKWGPPAKRTTAVIGRNDRTKTEEGESLDIVEIAPREDRDLALLRLGEPTFTVAPVALRGTTSTGRFTGTGWGATTTEARPDVRQEAQFDVGVNAWTATDFELYTAPENAPVPCSGDLGGPVLHTEGGTTTLAGVFTTTGGPSCSGETAQPAPRPRAARTDNLHVWLKAHVYRANTVKGVENRNILRVTSAETGTCLTATWPADLQTCEGQAVQQLEVVGDGQEVLLREQASRQCLEVAEDRVLRADCRSDLKQQQWQFLPGKSGKLEIRNLLADARLTANAPGGYRVSTQPADHTRAQQWEISVVGKTRYDVGGRHSLAAVNDGLPDHYVRHAFGQGQLSLITAGSPDLDKADATFKLVPGFTDTNCFAIESVNYPGRFLRHANGRIRLDAYETGTFFPADATWCAREGIAGKGTTFTSSNYPDNTLRHFQGALWSAHKGGAQPYETAESFEADSSFVVGQPLAK